MEIFKLFGSIFVNTDAADASMKKTEKGAESIASKLGAGIKTAAKWGTAIVTGATVAATAVLGLATDASSAADEIDKMSQKIGFSTEAYQEWEYIASKCSTSMDALQGGITDLAEKMDDAATGSGEAAEIFQKLGVSVMDAEGNLRSQQEVFEETIIALQNMENATERQALATKLMSTTGEELLPLLNGQVGSINDLKNSAHELGLVMSNDTVSAGVALKNTMTDIKQSFSIIGTQLGIAVIPIIQQFADLIIQNMPIIQQMLAQLGPILANVVATFLPVITELIQLLLPVLLDLFSELMPIITEMAAMILPVITELMDKLLPPLMTIVEALLPVIITLMDALMPIVEVLLELLTPILDVVLALLVPLVELSASILQPIIELLSILIEQNLKQMVPVIKTVASLISLSLNAALKALEPVVQGAIDVFSGLVDFITGVFSGDWETAWSGVVQIFAGIFEGIVDIVKFPLNQIISAINGVFKSLGELKIPDWVPEIGGTTFELPQIPLLAKGGDIVKAGNVIVGEQGPELLSLPVGARVTPLSGNSGIRDIDEIENILMNHASIIVNAIAQLQESGTIKVDDPYNIFRLVRDEKNKFETSTGGEW